MLRRVQLRNFKLHADTSIEAAPITVFIGPNSSGKSSIFQALLLWRQAAARNSPELCTKPNRREPNEKQPYIFPADQLIDAGDFDQVVKKGERQVAISMRGDVPAREIIEYGPGPTHTEFEVRIRENLPVYHAGHVDYWIERLNRKGRTGWSWPPEVRPQSLGLEPVRFGSYSVGMGVTSSLALVHGTSLTGTGQQPAPDEWAAIQEFGRRMGDAPASLLSSIHPVYPLRGLEEAGYPLADAPAENLDRMALQDRTIALLSVLAFNREVEREISDWLAELAGIKIEVKLLREKRVTLLCAPIKGLFADSLFSNEGTGATQLPFILVPVGLTPRDETILLSEPEVHLHPRLQAEMTRLLVKLTKNERRQFFIETHSEHVLHTLLNLVAKHHLTTSDLAIYYFEKRDGEAVCERLEIDERGGVAGGLPGFFDQSLGELAEYLGASHPNP